MESWNKIGTQPLNSSQHLRMWLCKLTPNGLFYAERVGFKGFAGCGLARETMHCLHNSLELGVLHVTVERKAEDLLTGGLGDGAVVALPPLRNHKG